MCVCVKAIDVFSVLVIDLQVCSIWSDYWSTEILALLASVCNSFDSTKIQMQVTLILFTFSIIAGVLKQAKKC